MSRKIGMVLGVIVALASVGIAITLSQQEPKVPVDEDGVTIIANDTESTPKEILSVTSQRSAFPFVQRWVSQYNNAENAAGNVEVNYYLDEPDAPSDLMFVGDIRHTEKGSQIIPVGAQAVVIVYNIPSFPDIPSGLKLNASVLSSILNGTVARWDDPAIKSLNQDMNLPAERIIVVHENNNGSSLGLIERYLSTDIKWPADSVGVLGPDELAAHVRKTPYSIGYVDFSYAVQTRMTFAAIAANGDYLMPSMKSIGQAIELQDFTSGNLVINTTKFDNSSYPLVGLYYVSWQKAEMKNATMDFVSWIIRENVGQQTLTEVEYPPIYRDEQPLVTYAERIINGTLAEG